MGTRRQRGIWVPPRQQLDNRVTLIAQHVHVVIRGKNRRYREADRSVGCFWPRKAQSQHNGLNTGNVLATVKEDRSNESLDGGCHGICRNGLLGRVFVNEPVEIVLKTGLSEFGVVRNTLKNLADKA